MSNEEKILDFISSLNIQTSRQKPSEWAEMYRVVTSGSNHKGKWSYNLTPYTKEIVDRLSPEDPMRVLALMAGSQLGKSHGFIFNGIGYIIKNRPTNILLTCGDDDLVKDSMTKIDEVIQNSGLKHLIRPNVIKKGNQKSGEYR
jgi:phage terminase large subunit GpA-like protein